MDGWAGRAGEGLKDRSAWTGGEINHVLEMGGEEAMMATEIEFCEFCVFTCPCDPSLIFLGEPSFPHRPIGPSLRRAMDEALPRRMSGRVVDLAERRR